MELACRLALDELRISSNIGSGLTTCNASPVVVTAAALSNTSTPASAHGQPASQVAVSYTTQNLIPIPGLLACSATFYRTVQMRLRS